MCWTAFKMLLLLICCGTLALLSGPLNVAADLGTASNPIKVCMQQTRPYTIVEEGTGAISGYEPDLFNRLAADLGLASQTRVIQGFSDLISGLLLPANDSLHCDIAMSGMGTANVPISAGVRYSETIFRNGMSVLINAEKTSDSDLWAFGRVFAVDLWIALIITAFVLGLLVLAVERDFKKKGLGKIKYPMDVRPGLIESFFQAFSKLVNNSNGIPASSIGAKFISLGWGLVVLVVISSYTAGLTTSLTVSSLQSSITSFKDLSNPGLVIGSWIYYRDAGLFNRYGFRPVGMPWNSQPDVNAMIDTLAAGQLDALVLDTGILRYNIGSRCDVALVGPVFLYSEIVYAMHSSITPAFMSRFNIGLIKLQQEGVNEELEAIYMPNQKCSADQVSTAITFSKVKGVFIVLGALTGLGLLLALLPKISKRFEADTGILASQRSGDLSVGTRIKSIVSKLSFKGAGTMASSTSGKMDMSNNNSFSPKDNEEQQDTSVFGDSMSHGEASRR